MDGNSGVNGTTHSTAPVAWNTLRVSGVTTREVGYGRRAAEPIGELSVLLRSRRQRHQPESRKHCMARETN